LNFASQKSKNSFQFGYRCWPSAFADILFGLNDKKNDPAVYRTSKLFKVCPWVVYEKKGLGFENEEKRGGIQDLTLEVDSTNLMIP